MYICLCNAVTDADIQTAVDNGVRNMRQLGKTTGCSRSCGGCKELARDTLRQVLIAKTQSSSLLSILQPA